VKVAIIDYGSGNLRSAAKAFERAAAEREVRAQVLVTSDPHAVAGADRVVLPGVGAFADCKRGLEAVAGMGEALQQAVREKGRPFLGICVGMQLMATRGLEFETVEGLGWIPGEVRAIEPDDPSLKIPHMGWNTLRFAMPTPLLRDVPEGSACYFVHSYYCVPRREQDIAAVAEYPCGRPFAASIRRDNLYATQFHPEKSQRVGLGILDHFAKL